MQTPRWSQRYPYKSKGIKNTLGFHYNCYTGKHVVTAPVRVPFSSKLTEYIKEFTKNNIPTPLFITFWALSAVRGPQNYAKVTKIGPKGGQGPPKWPQRGPKGTQRDPIDTQRVPKGSQRGSNRHPKVTNMLPKRPLGNPRNSKSPIELSLESELDVLVKVSISLQSEFDPES